MREGEPRFEEPQIDVNENAPAVVQKKFQNNNL